jgi:phosphoribosylformylglycinamidine cyclo-ligase
MTVTYKDAGVDIEKAESSLGALKASAMRTPQDGVLSGVGGFGGLFALAGYEEPVLVSGTDGVGTKLMIALEAGRFDGLGQDLVAMCANDILCTGAKPLFFLDYFATGKLDPAVLEAIVDSVADACVEIGCALLGGETAELPGLYEPPHFDLAGFCVGAVEKKNIVDGSQCQVNDTVIGLASNGVHSNGVSLARKVLLDVAQLELEEKLEDGRTVGEHLLEPTRLYGPLVLGLLEDVPLRGIAHITGGGLPGNLHRCLPDGLGAVIRSGSWPEPPVFEEIRTRGPVDDDEMARTFNMGIGMCLVVSPDDAETVIKRCNEEGTPAWPIGHLIETDPASDGPRVVYEE